jgi:hypothetical protein
MTLSIFDISDKWGISLRKLRAMELAGDIILNGSQSPKQSREMRYYLAKNKPLPVGHCVQLAQDPNLFLSLGDHARKARRQIFALGDIAGEALPASAAGMLVFAGKNQPQEVAELARWIARAIPAQGCGYHYIGARMLYNVPKLHFAAVYKLLPRAVLNARNHSELQGMIGSDKSGMRFSPRQFDL